MTPMIQHNVRDTVLLSGWLFADLLLGLMVIFLASIPGAQPVPPIIPTLSVTPTTLSPTDPACSGGTEKPRCTLTVGETPASVGPISWSVSSDISDAIVFSPSSGTLSPGKTTQVVISSLPCQNGSFTFSGSRNASPVIVSWHCTKPAERLDFQYKTFNLNIQSVSALLNNDASAVSDIQSQVRNQPILQGHRIGLAIVYGGAPTAANIPTAQQISQKIYDIFQVMGSSFPPLHDTSYYNQVYALGSSPNSILVHVYLFAR
jgi:hypothetical protein